MDGFIKRLVIVLMILSLAACATQSPEGDVAAGDDFSTEMDEASKPEEAQQATQDEFSEMNEDSGEQAQADDGSQSAEDIENEIANSKNQDQKQTVDSDVKTDQVGSAKITGIKFKKNESGGTIVLEGSGPFNYTTQLNSDVNQYIIEIPNVILDPSLKGIQADNYEGVFGSVEAQQSSTNDPARIIIQLIAGTPEPSLSMEGSSLIVMSTTPDAKDLVATDDMQTLPGSTLEEYLAGHHKFAGKKISMEMNDMDLRDALKFISDEAGVNMVISEDVKGTVSLKLRQVPWDQALVVIMKAKKLGYTRQGNVIRIAQLSDLKIEEEEANKLADYRKSQQPLKIKSIPISFAKTEEVTKQVQGMLSERGKVIGDSRTSTIVVTDIEENLNRVIKLIASLDTAPPQVLIEGKIVEANEGFQHSSGINWRASGTTSQIAEGNSGPINMTPSINMAPGLPFGAMNLNLNIGTLDNLGDLNATISLFEQESLLKVISSPRIVTLHNEAAEINQTTEIPLKQISRQNGESIETIGYKPLKLKLNVLPQITTDGSVIMGVDVAREFLGEKDRSGNNLVNSRYAKTKVHVKNGQTAVIGGIYQSDAVQTDTGVPWIRKIPVLGALFKSTVEQTQKSELLIFLTPRILGQVDSQTISNSESSTITK